MKYIYYDTNKNCAFFVDGNTPEEALAAFVKSNPSYQGVTAAQMHMLRGPELMFSERWRTGRFFPPGPGPGPRPTPGPRPGPTPHPTPPPNPTPGPGPNPPPGPKPKS